MKGSVLQACLWIGIVGLLAGCSPSDSQPPPSGSNGVDPRILEAARSSIEAIASEESGADSVLPGDAAGDGSAGGGDVSPDYYSAYNKSLAGGASDAETTETEPEPEELVEAEPGAGYMLETEPHNLPEWTYSGETGPENWAGLSEVCAPCGTGLEQSPIDLTGANGEDLENPVFHYGSTQIHIENNGHTVQVNVDPGHWIELDGVRYDLLQFHFHSPSEHAEEGERTDAEMHLVHRNAEGELAVVGVFMSKGTKHEGFAEMLEFLPSESGMELDFTDSASISALLPEEHTAYRYNGSLTTPPCSEGVKWVVLTEPVYLSFAQLQPLVEILGENSRPLQPLKERVLQVDTTP